MPKPIIAIDIDDVLMPHFQDLIAWYNQQFGTNLTLADNYSGNLELWGTETEEQAIQRVQQFYATPEFAASLPRAEAKAVLRRLSPRYDLVVITARDTIIEQATRDWLDSHFAEVFSAVHFTAFYALDGSRRTKADVCREIGAQYLIDDTPHHALPAAEAGLTVLLFGDYPWNQLDSLPPGVVKCSDWAAVLQYFETASI